MDVADVVTAGGLVAFGQVIMIDLLLAGDNVVVLGALAAGLPPADRKRVLALGVGVALVCRVGFALIATKLLDIVGLQLAGGLLLIWVAWKMYREIRGGAAAGPDADGLPPTPKTFARAAIQVAIADLSMSLDNILAVAGAARDHPAVLYFGLVLSVALMAVAASYIAKVIERYHWVAYLGLIVIVYVAGSMIVDGGRQIMPLVS